MRSAVGDGFVTARIRLRIDMEHSSTTSMDGLRVTSETETW